MKKCRDRLFLMAIVYHKKGNKNKKIQHIYSFATNKMNKTLFLNSQQLEYI